MRCHSVICGTLNQMQSTTQSFSRSHDAVIRVYDEAGNVIETHEHAGDFKRAVVNGNPIATPPQKNAGFDGFRPPIIGNRAAVVEAGFAVLISCLTVRLLYDLRGGTACLRVADSSAFIRF